MRDRFLSLYRQYITRSGSEELLDFLLGSDFFEAPASTRFHLAEEGGLVTHSVNVWEEMIRLLKAYPEVRATAETVAIITLLHDLCKIGCYKTEFRNRKNDRGMWEKYPVFTFNEDFCYGGHGSKSVFLIQRFMNLSEEEAVAINCHMGFSDRSPSDFSLGKAFEQYPLAWLLHVADESASYIREK